MNRRRLLGALASLAAARPDAVSAQTAERPRRIVALQELAPDDAEAQRRVAALERALAKFGWVNGRNLAIEYRWGAGDPRRIHDLALQTVGSAPDLIFTAATSVLQEVAPATRSIPIVFVLVSDPVGLGFVESLAHPGGNVTGFAVFEPEIGGKWLELLKQMAQGIARVSFLFNPATAPIGESLSRALVAAAPRFALTAAAAPVHDEREIDAAITATASTPGGSLVIAPDTFTYIHRDSIVASAARHRLPAIYPFRDFVTAGGLMSYGVDLLAPFSQAAAYLDRILRGASPATLPVQDPTEFDLVVNLSSARALGLAVPPTLLARADEVIE